MSAVMSFDLLCQQMMLIRFATTIFSGALCCHFIAFQAPAFHHQLRELGEHVAAFVRLASISVACLHLQSPLISSACSFIVAVIAEDLANSIASADLARAMITNAILPHLLQVSPDYKPIYYLQLASCAASGVQELLVEDSALPWLPSDEPSLLTLKTKPWPRRS